MILRRLKLMPPEWRLISLLAVFKLLLHLFTNTHYELHRDAFLYLAQGDHLAFGQFSVPPGISFVAWVTQLMGNSLFVIRLVPALVGVAGAVLVALIVKEAGGRRWAIALAMLCFILSPAFLRSNTLFQPVSFNQFFWVLSAYIFIRMLKSGDTRHWLYLGIAWGVAFLFKYSIVFFAAGLLVGLLMTPQRNLFNSKHFLYAIAIGALIILPNILWQASHNWLVLHHMSELRQTQLVNVSIGNFLGMQFLFHHNGVIIWVTGLLYLLFNNDGRIFRAAGLGCLATVGILIALSGKHYYTLGIYPLLFAFGGVFLEDAFANKRRWVRPALLAVIVIGLLPIAPFSLPLLSMPQMAAYAKTMAPYGLEGTLRWEDGRIHDLPQDYADMTGWEELAGIVIKTWQSLSPEEQQQCTIFAGNYGMAGAIHYYGKKEGLPEPISFSDSYLLWAPDELSGNIVIYIDDNLGEDIAAAFEDITFAGKLSDPYARESGTEVYLCRGLKAEFRPYYAERVRSEKAIFHDR